MSSPAVEVARSYLGTKTGSAAVAKFLAFVHLLAPNAWCLAFALFCAGAGSGLPRLARCSLFWSSVSANPIRYETFTPEDVAWGVATPHPGDICIFAHHPDKHLANWDGHAATVTKWLGNGRIATIEGNTSSNAKGDQRNGGVVAEKVRQAGVASFLLEGFVRPRR